MDDAGRARAAAVDAVSDVKPAALHDFVAERLASVAVAPGATTIEWARRAGGAPRERVAERAAGVQLIFEGLSVTRSLVRSPPWGQPEAAGTGNLAILAADVLVARGFSLLADTEAAQKAVETVRSFGRDEADRAGGGSPPVRSLEADVFELAIIAGATAAGGSPPPDAGERAVGLAESLERPVGASEEASVAGREGERSAAPPSERVGSSASDS